MNFFVRLWALSFLPLSCAFGYETTKEFKRDLWEASARSSFFLTQANYDNSGGTASLMNGGKYQIFDFNFRNRYSFSPLWALYADVNIAAAESSALGVIRKNSSFTSALVGGELSMDLGGVKLIPEASFLFPFEKIKTDTDNVTNAEGVTEFLLKANVQSYYGPWVFMGYLGYNVRGEGRAHQYVWSGGVQYRWATLDFGARLFGYQRASDDQDANSFRVNDRAYFENRVNAGSFRFYSINPSLTDSEVNLTYHFDKQWSLGLALGTTLSGSNSAQGMHGDGVITFRPFAESARSVPTFTPDGLSSPSMPTRRSSPAPSKKTPPPQGGFSVDPYSKDFNEDVDDGVDQNIFRAPPQNKPKEPEDIRGGAVPQDDGTPAIPATRVTPAPAEPNVRLRPAKRVHDDARATKKKLDDAEMTIELRMNKKKRKR